MDGHKMKHRNDRRLYVRPSYLSKYRTSVIVFEKTLSNSPSYKRIQSGIKNQNLFRSDASKM